MTARELLTTLATLDDRELDLQVTRGYQLTVDEVLIMVDEIALL